MAIATPAPQRAAGRRRLAKKKQALPDGSFPIPNVSYLGKAIRAVGRAAPGKRPALARLIRKRAKQLGSAGMAKVKGSWADSSQSKKAMANACYRQFIELGFTPELAKAETQATMAFMILELATPVVGSTDGPKVTTLAGPKYDKNPAGRAKPNKASFVAGSKGKKPTSSGSDWPPSTAKSYTEDLEPHQKVVLRKLIARGTNPKVALAAASRAKKKAA